MTQKNFRVAIGRLMELHFTNQRDALAFMDGFNYARRQRDEIIYEFKDQFKTRGFAFAFKILHWLEKENIRQEWHSTRPSLTNICENGNHCFSPDATQPRLD
jgi:hypothetical protein